MRKHLRRSTLRRRILALMAAYAVVISSFVASFGAASAAAEGTFDPFGAICHHSTDGQSGPLSDRSNGNTCIDCCCVGCLMPMDALPPPPAAAAPAPVAVAYRLAPLAVIALSGARTAKSHRSRAPPYAV
ncbi:MAG TPA: hypothetical protein VL048_13100 [Xanthobacteraceae bacterium]|nr:hypothetical protein [Xanthobacteraceae bacterium]